MANEFAKFYIEDIDDVFLQEFAQEIEFDCGAAGVHNARGVFMRKTDIDDFVEGTLIVITKSDYIPCQKPVIRTEKGVYYTIYREDDMEGMSILHLSEDATQEVTI